MIVVPAGNDTCDPKSFRTCTTKFICFFVLLIVVTVEFTCNDKNNIGCTNPDDLFGSEGVEPYYIEVASDISNSPFDKKCVFCWQLSSFI